jgi:branched-chain amino acid transport system ATP-binding protein
MSRPAPRSGHIWIAGEETTGWPPHKVVDKGVSYIPAERHIFPGLSVEENLKMGKRASDEFGSLDCERVYGYFPKLAERRKQDGGTLSGGEQQMLCIGRGLMANPTVMLLDEPSQGLAPILLNTIVDIIKKLHEEHHFALLIVEQNYRITLRIANRNYLM